MNEHFLVISRMIFVFWEWEERGNSYFNNGGGIGDEIMYQIIMNNFIKPQGLYKV